MGNKHVVPATPPTETELDRVRRAYAILLNRTDPTDDEVKFWGDEIAGKTFADTNRWLLARFSESGGAVIGMIDADINAKVKDAIQGVAVPGWDWAAEARTEWQTRFFNDIDITSRDELERAVIDWVKQSATNTALKVSPVKLDPETQGMLDVRDADATALLVNLAERYRVARWTQGKTLYDRFDEWYTAQDDATNAALYLDEMVEFYMGPGAEREVFASPGYPAALRTLLSTWKFRITEGRGGMGFDTALTSELDGVQAADTGEYVANCVFPRWSTVERWVRRGLMPSAQFAVYVAQLVSPGSSEGAHVAATPLKGRLEQYSALKAGKYPLPVGYSTFTDWLLYHMLLNWWLSLYYSFVRVTTKTDWDNRRYFAFVQVDTRLPSFRMVHTQYGCAFNNLDATRYKITHVAKLREDHPNVFKALNESAPRAPITPAIAQFLSTGEDKAEGLQKILSAFGLYKSQLTPALVAVCESFVEHGWSDPVGVFWSTGDLKVLERLVIEGTGTDTYKQALQDMDVFGTKIQGAYAFMNTLGVDARLDGQIERGFAARVFYSTADPGNYDTTAQRCYNFNEAVTKFNQFFYEGDLEQAKAMLGNGLYADGTVAYLSMRFQWAWLQETILSTDPAAPVGQDDLQGLRHDSIAYEGQQFMQAKLRLLTLLGWLSVLIQQGGSGQETTSLTPRYLGGLDVNKFMGAKGIMCPPTAVPSQPAPAPAPAPTPAPGDPTPPPPDNPKLPPPPTGSSATTITLLSLAGGAALAGGVLYARSKRRRVR